MKENNDFDWANEIEPEIYLEPKTYYYAEPPLNKGEIKEFLGLIKYPNWDVYDKIKFTLSRLETLSYLCIMEDDGWGYSATMSVTESKELFLGREIYNEVNIRTLVSGITIQESNDFDWVEDTHLKLGWYIKNGELKAGDILELRGEVVSNGVGEWFDSFTIEINENPDFFNIINPTKDLLIAFDVTQPNELEFFISDHDLEVINFNRDPKKGGLRESDFDWVDDIPEYEMGEFLEGSEVCEDSGDDCDINFNYGDNEIVFVLDFDEWKNFVGADNWILDELLRYGMDEDHNTNLRGEMDSGEIDYLHHYLNQEQKNRFNKILNITTNGKVTVDNLSGDNFSDIKELLLHPDLKRLWDYFIFDYLAPLERAWEINTWRDLRDEYKSILSKNNIEIEVESTFRSEDIKITVPMDVLSNNNIFNLSDLIEFVSDDFLIEWDDVAWGNYDTSGSEDEVDGVINKFLTDVEEILEDDDIMAPYQEFLTTINKIGFEPLGEAWVEGIGTDFYYTKKISDSVYVSVTPRIDDEESNVYLIKHPKRDGRWGNIKPFSGTLIPIEDIGTHVYNLTLDL